MIKEKNAELIRLAHEGDREAMELLVSENMGLCKNIASRFRDRGVEYDDLVQLAAIGMIKAIKSFDFSYNTVFSTYAVPLIIGEIRRFLRDDGAIKVSREIKKIGINAMRKKEEYVRKNGKEPKINELSELCGVSADELIFSLEAISSIRSLSEPIGDDSDGNHLEDMIADSEDKFLKITDKIALTEAIKQLSEEHKRIVYLRYYKDLSQSRTGQILGMTQVKVSREEKKIIQFLKKTI